MRAQHSPVPGRPATPNWVAPVRRDPRSTDVRNTPRYRRRGVFRGGAPPGVSFLVPTPAPKAATGNSLASSRGSAASLSISLEFPAVFFRIAPADFGALMPAVDDAAKGLKKQERAGRDLHASARWLPPTSRGAGAPETAQANGASDPRVAVAPYSFEVSSAKIAACKPAGHSSFCGRLRRPGS